VIRILHADDHPLILRGVRELLEGREDMTVVGQEQNSDNAVRAVARLEPDVLIQDLEMQGQLNGIEVIRHVAENHPTTRIVVLSMHSAVASAWEAMQQGALGYVTKLGDFNDLIQAVIAVNEGRRFVGAPLSESELEEYTQQLELRGVQSMSSLTKREIEILSMVARGHTSSEIADLLHIGRRTVESHRASLSSKLGLRNQAELTRYAMERGLVVDTPNSPSRR
jgi:two-component system, NarL family, response regulator NreC